MKAEIKHKNVPFPKDLFERLEIEKYYSGINANSIVIIAVDSHLKMKEKERRKESEKFDKFINEVGL